MSASQTVGSGQTDDISGDVAGTITLEPLATLEVLAGTEASLFGGVVALEGATIEIDAGSILFAPATIPSDVSVVLKGPGSDLMLAASTMSDFDASLASLPSGALIDIAGVDVNSVAASTAGAHWALVLGSAAGVIGTIDVDAEPPSLLLSIPDGFGGSLLLAGTAPPAAALLPPPTQALGGTFTWTGGSSAAWAETTGWTEDGEASTRAPGLQDDVSIAGGPAGVTAMAGAGSCATLSTSGEVALTGAFSLTTMLVGATAADALILMTGADVTDETALLRAGVLCIQSGTMSIGGTLAVAGLFDGRSGSLISVASLLLAYGDLRLSADTSMVVGTGGPTPGVLTVARDGAIVGTGTIDAGVALAGSIEVTAGTLSVFGAVSGDGTIALDSGATLFAAGGLGTSTIIFDSDEGATLETFGALSGALVTGFAQSDILEIADAATGTLTWSPAGLGGTLDLGIYGNIGIALASDLDPQHAQFVEASDGFGGIAITALPCFAAATRLQTPDGWIEAGKVTPRTWLCTATGAARRAIWIGRTAVQGRHRASAPYLDPVLLHVDALGGSRPVADLRLSPLHGIVADTASGPRIVPAVALCDGRRIVRERSNSSFEYVHIALDCHDALLAEGVACESFLPHGPDPRAQFERSSGPRPSRFRPLASRLEDGFLLRDLRERLNLQSAITSRRPSRGNIDVCADSPGGQRLEGWVEGAADIEIRVDGRTAWRGARNAWRADLEFAGIESGFASFVATIPKPAPCARISVSNSL